MTWIDVLKHGLANDSREDREIISEFDKLHERYMEWYKRATPNMKTSGGMKSKEYEEYQLMGADILAKLGIASKEYGNLIRENVSDSPRRPVMRQPFNSVGMPKPLDKSITKGRYDNYFIDILIKQIGGVLVALEDDSGDYELDDHELGITVETLEKMRDHLQKERI